MSFIVVSMGVILNGDSDSQYNQLVPVTQQQSAMLPYHLNNEFKCESRFKQTLNMSTLHCTGVNIGFIFLI